jgi:hypothetical protein
MEGQGRKKTQDRIKMMRNDALTYNRKRVVEGKCFMYK